MNRWLKIAAVAAVAFDFLTPGMGFIGGSFDYAVGHAKAAGLPANTLQNSVTSVTAQTSTAGVMAGLGAAAVQFTPHYDGVALLTISGTAVFSATGATGILQLRYGTGAGPANNAAATGLTCGPTLAPTPLTGVLTQMFSVQCIATGMALNVPYWIDMLMGSSSGTAQITNASISAAEL